MDSKQYWKKRAERKHNILYRSVDEYQEELFEIVTEAQEEAKQKVSYYYAKYAKENGMSYQDAIQYMSHDDVKVFKKDIKKYLKEIQSLGDSEEAENLLKELNALSLNQRITRLQSIEIEMKAILGMNMLQDIKLFTDRLTKLFKDAYYRTIYDLSQDVGVSASFFRINKRALDEALAFPWSGADFKTRLVGGANETIKLLRQELTKHFIQGSDLRKVISDVANRYDVHKNKVGMLFQTESAALISQAQNKAFEESGVVEEYEILATLDSRTSSICQNQDGRVYKLSDYKVGVTASPFHPRCRSTEIPVFEDEEDKSYRAARTNENSRLKVDANMKYDEWYNEYVGKTEKQRENEKIEKIRADILQGNVNLKANKGSQEKHIRGTHQYNTKIESHKKKGKQEPSYLFISFEESKALIEKYAGSGRIKLRGDKNFVEFIKLDYIIGVHIDQDTGVRTETNGFKIHYGKTGTHIVPTLID